MLRTTVHIYRYCIVEQIKILNVDSVYKRQEPVNTMIKFVSNVIRKADLWNKKHKERVKLSRLKK